MKVTLFDYGVGNIHSIRKAVEGSGAAVERVTDPKGTLDARVLVLPGVGAFGKVAESLSPARAELRRRMEEGLPVLAICIGMHVLYESSEEAPGEGIGLLSGRVRKLEHERLPHIGWNTVEHDGTGLFEGIPASPHFYFVHSYAPSPVEGVTVATSDYGGVFGSVVRKANVWGVQFHPEKSSDLGRRVLRNFFDHLVS